MPPRTHTPRLFVHNVDSVGMKPIAAAARSIGITTVSTETEPWDVLWTYKVPWQLGIPSLEKHRLRAGLVPRGRASWAVNHVAGLLSLASKRELVKLSAALEAAELQLHNRTTPDTYILPAQLEPFRARVQREGLNDASGWPNWLVKSPQHRGIHVLSDSSARALKALGEALAQARVRPLLLPGLRRAFDVGVYVLLSSVRPMRAYAFNEQLVRFCEQEYPRTPSDFAVAARYVIKEYSPVWSLAPMAPELRACNASPGCALRRKLTANGVDADGVWRRMRGVARRLLNAMQPTIEVGLSLQRIAAQSTFELLRFDFMLSDAAAPVLTEVNLSPNMVPRTREDGEVKQRLLRGVLKLVLQRLAPSPSPREPLVGISCTSTVCCGLRRDCPAAGYFSGECLTAADIARLRLAELEDAAAAANGFVRILPPPPTEAPTAANGYVSREDALQACWLAAVEDARTTAAH